MEGSNKIFIDTAPFIYYLEKNPYYFDIARKFFDKCREEEIDMVTSAVTVEEYCVYPYRTQQLEYIENFEEFLNNLNIDIINIDSSIAKQASRIRAQFKDFKSLDALQIAAGIVSGCDLFLTNDKQLCQERDIKCLTLDELKVS